MFDFQKGLFLLTPVEYLFLRCSQYISFEMNWKTQFFATPVQIFKAAAIIDLE